VSGFAAIIRFDGAPADPAALAAMTRAIEYRGPDGIRQWSGEGAAIAHLMLHTTPESLEEAQPLASEDAGLVLAMDGWLANPQELRSELLARGARLRTRSDAELVLRAYEAWGDECPARIEGEYAFVVWDARRREVLCARDHAGLRPLHYHWDGKRLLVASDLAGVLAAGDFEQRPNLGVMAEHLTNEWYTADETLWVGVNRLPPARIMRVGAGGPRIRRHWTPPLEVTIRYPRDEDYQAHYRALFEDAVRRASRSHKPLACEVSGGHDSSAVFAIAERLRKAGELQAPGLKGYTFKFGEETDADVDEIEYARAVGAHLGAEIAEIPPFLPKLEWFAERMRADRELIYPNASMAVAIGRALTADGSVVAFNGEGGDEFFACSYPFNYAEHLAERDWRSLAASLREDLAALGLKQTLWYLFRGGLGPLAPKPLRALRRRLMGPPAGLGRMLLTPDLLQTLEQRRLATQNGDASRTVNPTRRGMYMTLEYPNAMYVHDFIARAGARLGYELRSPFFARPLLEFAFAIPDRQRRRGNFHKYMHIKSIGDDLPAMVADRRTKSEFSLTFKRQLDNAREYVLARMLQCGIEGIDTAALDRFYWYCESGPEELRSVYDPWELFGCVTLFGRTSGS